MRYIVKDTKKMLAVFTEAQDMLSAKNEVAITVEEVKDTRRQAQNRLMHKWFRDIANSTKNDVVYESGRCKLAYFLPALLSSDKEKAVTSGEMIKEIIKARGYEYASLALGNSLIASTSLLSTKEFAQAMNEMYLHEAEHQLTNPNDLRL